MLKLFGFNLAFRTQKSIECDEKLKEKLFCDVLVFLMVGAKVTENVL